jgi:hypothetical protein
MLRNSALESEWVPFRVWLKAEKDQFAMRPSAPKGSTIKGIRRVLLSLSA